jgi:transcriptional regulator with XRE-family HTH domain
MDLSEFVESEMRKRGWNQADLARFTGMTTGGVSMLLNRTRKPNPDTLIALAKAFTIPAETLFRVAGFLPEVTTIDSQKEELLYLFDQLPEKEKKDLLKYVRINLEMLKHPESK